MILDPSARMSHKKQVPLLATNDMLAASDAAKEHFYKTGRGTAVYMPGSNGYCDYRTAELDPAPPKSPIAEFVVFWIGENRDNPRASSTEHVFARHMAFADRKKADKFYKDMVWRHEHDAVYRSRFVSNVVKNF